MDGCWFSGQIESLETIQEAISPAFLSEVLENLFCCVLEARISFFY